MPVDVLCINTDDGGTLELCPFNRATGEAMLRIVPASQHGVYWVDSVGFFKGCNGDLRKLAKEILRFTAKNCCCGKCDND